MPSNRWLKSTPASKAASESKPAPTPNVSMSDVRRLEQEKRQKAQEPPPEPTGETEAGNQDNLSSRSNMSCQPNMSWQLKMPLPGGPMSSQLNMGSQPNMSSQPNMDNQVEPPIKLLASLPEVKGDARLPHKYTDHLCRLLKPDEQAVYLQLYRLSWGWGQETCFISNPRLSERSNVPLSSMKRAVAGLLDKGLIEKTGHTTGYGKDQGVEYRVPTLGWQPNMSSQPNMSWQPRVDPNKINTHKEHTQTQEPPAAAVRVGSKFSLEQCRSYAAHLRSTGQGINNPGGYATTIHRTGEADALIEAFLNPRPSAEQVDASRCPDCQGTGFYYPKGVEQGVAKCQHARLNMALKGDPPLT
jgi:Helix-turn-helix domain